MSEINYKLISEIIFTNETTFRDIDIKNAKIIVRICKLARLNKNIKLSFDNFKIDKYFKQVIYTSEKKLMKDEEKYAISTTEKLGVMNLDINTKYKAKIYNIIINLLKENDYIIEGVKKKMFFEQRDNIKKFASILKIMKQIRHKAGVDINDIKDDFDDLDSGYFDKKYDIANIKIIFKYNSYFINMLSRNLVNEKVVIDFISGEFFDKIWYKIPIKFPKSLINFLY